MQPGCLQLSRRLSLLHPFQEACAWICFEISNNPCLLFPGIELLSFLLSLPDSSQALQRYLRLEIQHSLRHLPSYCNQGIWSYHYV